jgi:hypothetical protein
MLQRLDADDGGGGRGVYLEQERMTATSLTRLAAWHQLATAVRARRRDGLATP